MQLGFKKLSPDAILPRYAHEGDAGMDVCAIEDVTLEQGIPTLVKTGLAAEIPAGYEIQVRPRSGLALKGVTVWNSPGTVDSQYRGPIGVILMFQNSTASVFSIHKGDRIAQLVLAPVTRAEVMEVSEVSTTERGMDGFGSTGV